MYLRGNISSAERDVNKHMRIYSVKSYCEVIDGMEHPLSLSISLTLSLSLSLVY